MQRTVPSTPAEALEISRGLRLILNSVCRAADLFRFWRSPAANAATDFEEMTLLDKIYWVYKSRQPVLEPEPGDYPDGFFRNIRPADPRLPTGFEKTASLTLGAAGDLIRAEGVENSRDVLYEKVAGLLFDQDVSYANLESQPREGEIGEEVLSDRESPVECCSFPQFAAMKGHQGKQFTVLHTACNHTLDGGIEGLQTTLRELAREDILDVGTNRERAGQEDGKILTRNGIRLGFAAATFSLNGRKAPRGQDHVVNVARLLPRKGKADLSLLEKQIASCRQQGCDLVIASLHWGYEFEFFPRKRQVAIARSLVESGADVILCHHPHVVQPVEFYRTRRDPDRVAVIAYSLGTLVWSFSAPHLVLSAILNLSVAKGRFRGEERTYVESVKVTPVFRTYTGSEEAPQIRIERLDAQPTGVGNDWGPVAEMKKYADLVFGNGKEQVCPDRC